MQVMSGDGIERCRKKSAPPRAVASVDEVGAGDIVAALDEATGEVACSARWFPDVVGKGEVRIVEQGIDGRRVCGIEVVGGATGIGVVGGSDGLEDGGLGAGPVFLHKLSVVGIEN